MAQVLGWPSTFSPVLPGLSRTPACLGSVPKLFFNRVRRPKRECCDRRGGVRGRARGKYAAAHHEKVRMVERAALRVDDGLGAVVLASHPRRSHDVAGTEENFELVFVEHHPAVLGNAQQIEHPAMKFDDFLE